MKANSKSLSIIVVAGGKVRDVIDKNFSPPNSPNRELSNDVTDVVVHQREVALHTISHLTPTEA